MVPMDNLGASVVLLRHCKRTPRSQRLDFIVSMLVQEKFMGVGGCFVLFYLCFRYVCKGGGV